MKKYNFLIFICGILILLSTFYLSWKVIPFDFEEVPGPVTEKSLHEKEHFFLLNILNKSCSLVGKVKFLRGNIIKVYPEYIEVEGSTYICWPLKMNKEVSFKVFIDPNTEISKDYMDNNYEFKQDSLGFVDLLEDMQVEITGEGLLSGDIFNADLISVIDSDFYERTEECY